MSGTPGDRWRGGGRGGFDPSRSRPRNQGGGGTMRDRPMANQDRHGNRNQSHYHHQNMASNGAHHHNAWGYGGQAGQAGNQAQEQQHVPVNGFNAAEARDALKQGFSSTVPVTVYRPPPSSNTKGGPWGSKPNCMANGRDFYLELRKQVSALQQKKGG